MDELETKPAPTSRRQPWLIGVIVTTIIVLLAGLGVGGYYAYVALSGGAARPVVTCTSDQTLCNQKCCTNTFKVNQVCHCLDELGKACQETIRNYDGVAFCCPEASFPIPSESIATCCTDSTFSQCQDGRSI